MRFHILLCVALIFAAQAGAEDLELKIPPVKTSFDVKGQAVKSRRGEPSPAGRRGHSSWH
jgi:hypothetical protein